MNSETLAGTPRTLSSAPLSARARLLAMAIVIGVYVALLGVMSLLSRLAGT